MKGLRRTVSCGLSTVALALLVTSLGCVNLRSSVEATLPSAEAGFLAAPSTDASRRAYADILFKLGDMRRASDVIAPLATTTATHADDLLLGSRLAYVLGEYQRAEALFSRLRDITTTGSKAHTAALEGLALTCYQTNRYDKAKSIDLPGGIWADGSVEELLTFMKRFVGLPYQIEWTSSDKVAHLPIVNDFTPAGALPLVRLKVNGYPVEFILDTGGDRLYIDEKVAERIGIHTIAKRKAQYAYTKGVTVDEPLGVADTVEMGEVTLRNVPVTVAQWKAQGQTSDGVVTTQVLKQFLSTVDYDHKEITLRERRANGLRQLLDALGKDPVRIPFWMASTHLMFAKGSINGRSVNLLVDSGLAASMPMVVTNEAVEDLGLSDKKVSIGGTPYFSVPITTHGMGILQRGATQALGNVFVDSDQYWGLGFLDDALISHQFLRNFGSWTIDFDSMTYYFPADSVARAESPGRNEG